MQEQRLTASDIAGVTAQVHQGAIDVLGPVTDPQTVHQSKFSMGTVLAMVAHHGRAGLAEFDAPLRDPATRALSRPRADGARPRGRRRLPARWIGKVSVATRDGRPLERASTSRRATPAIPLRAAELEDKADSSRGLVVLRPARPRCGALAARVWAVADALSGGRAFSAESPDVTARLHCRVAAAGSAVGAAVGVDGTIPARSPSCDRD